VETRQIFWWNSSAQLGESLKLAVVQHSKFSTRPSTLGFISRLRIRYARIYGTVCHSWSILFFFSIRLPKLLKTSFIASSNIRRAPRGASLRSLPPMCKFELEIPFQLGRDTLVSYLAYSLTATRQACQPKNTKTPWCVPSTEFNFCLFTSHVAPSEIRFVLTQNFTFQWRTTFVTYNFYLICSQWERKYSVLHRVNN
jgi:hypothetical protein